MYNILYTNNMKLDIAEVKSVVYPVRFDPETFEQIRKVAKQNKTSPSKVIRLFVEQALKPTKIK